MSPLDQKIQEAIDDLLLIPDAQERMAWVVDQAKRAPGLPADAKVDAHRIPGCVSNVWIRASLHEGRLELADDAESPLVRGLVHFVVRLYHGAAVGDIRASTLDPLAATGLAAGLSPTRQNGLRAVQAQIRKWAEAA